MNSTTPRHGDAHIAQSLFDKADSIAQLIIYLDALGANGYLPPADVLSVAGDLIRAETKLRDLAARHDTGRS